MIIFDLWRKKILLEGGLYGIIYYKDGVFIIYGL